MSGLSPAERSALYDQHQPDQASTGANQTAARSKRRRRTGSWHRIRIRLTERFKRFRQSGGLAQLLWGLAAGLLLGAVIAALAYLF